jgi:glycosyltransferase involved in cell wall biosynthesis
MIRVLLIHADNIPHYRVPIYSYLAKYLERYGFSLMVLSDGIQSDNPHEITFQLAEMPLSTIKIARFIYEKHIDIIIDYMELRHLYLFPTYLIAKGIMRKKIIYWGQGCDLADTKAIIKNLAYATEQSLSNAIILYAEHLKKYVPGCLHKKVFIANNTLCIDYTGLPAGLTRQDILAQYGINTKKNIICMGRMQKRKRVDVIVKALNLMNRPDVGLILVGPDTEGILDEIKDSNIYKLGPIYGHKKFDLISAADICCLPGAVGLSIIDAFHCGIPFVTEEGDESAEIMYLKHGINGFIVKRGDIQDMATKLTLLIDNDGLRSNFSSAAKREIDENGRIENMCSGFRDALYYVTGKPKDDFITQESTC